MPIDRNTARQCLITIILGITAAPVFAEVVPDQEQIAWRGLPPPVDIGGHLRQQVAQTYEAGVSGTLHHVRMLVACDDSTAGALHLDIQRVTPAGAPGGVVLGSNSVDSLTLLPGAGVDYVWHDFFPANVEQVDGTSYAIVMRGDEGTICYTPQGPVEGGMFAYPRGDAYIGEPAAGTVVWSQISDPAIDYVFYTYVELPEPPDGPDYCELTDVTGVPNDWLPEDVPACGCLVDPVFNAHRCWFGLPDFVLWREIAPFAEPGAKVEWSLLPLNSGISEVSAQEYSDSAQGPAVLFDKNLKPGKLQSLKFDATVFGETSSVSIMFLGPRGDAEVNFKVYQAIPE